MEFNIKLQELRKQKQLTQEELAQALFVSRAAVSKWESGRGYPSIDSLKALARFFSVSLDELLSGEELLSIAEEDSMQKENRCRDLVFGLLDATSIMFLVFPFFGQETDGIIRSVSLPAFTGASAYLIASYYGIVAGTALWGILLLALQGCCHPLWVKAKHKVSLILNMLGVLLFIISLQPYPGAFLFVLLIIKAWMLIKWP